MTDELTDEDRRWLDKDERSRANYGKMLVLIALLFLGATACLGWQIFMWLKTAAWPQLSFGEILRAAGGKPFHFSWAGVQKIADWIADVPAFAAFLSAGFLLMWALTWGDDKPQPEGLRTARMKQARLAAERKAP